MDFLSDFPRVELDEGGDSDTLLLKGPSERLTDRACTPDHDVMAVCQRSANQMVDATPEKG